MHNFFFFTGVFNCTLLSVSHGTNDTTRNFESEGNNRMIALLKARRLSDTGVALYQEKKFPRHLRFRRARL